ncbi:MAG TPA: type I-C CRISPR-associated protein Cas7/Csd2 [Kiritimatiellia bacterium]|nr:type I-C CRISPR-associated protein Cas7/Csd2 [Kiritimatiellia bacterium]HRZ12382.1 type I-C CRISPR-associated protein Cas7/Csd2 [Kiritimatiellia bacterium]HSA17860.1 type I-C CRISPR-associated protein Cas7/Csd2 [Kiritimatiellia bacterium]
MTEAIKNRFEFVYLFDVENGNPNGDPDAGNMPRIDPETGHGIVTDVCLKRKVRNYVQLAKDDEAPFMIYVKEKAVLSTSRAPAYKATEVEGDEEKRIAAARAWMCEHFYDVRTFGAVMSTKVNNCGQVRGPVQFSFGRSVEPIAGLELSITRMAVETEQEAKDQAGDNRTMGRKHAVPYALYRSEGFISAPLAAQTGFSEDDLELLWQALQNMFEHDHSAARGKMAARKLIVFKHADKLGKAPAQALFDLVGVERSGDVSKPARAYSDYKVRVNKAGVPAGVELIEML